MKNKSTRVLLLVGQGYEAADFRYACGLSLPDAAVYLQVGRKRTLVVPEMEYGRACRETNRGIKVVTPTLLEVPSSARGKLSEWVVALLGCHSVKAVTVSSSFPVGLADELRQQGISLEVKLGSLFPERAVKSAVEIEHIREAQQAAVLAVRAACAELATAGISAQGLLQHKGHTMTSEHLRAVIERVLLDRDCVASETIVACGRDGADPHERGSGPLLAGQPIVLDVFPRHRGHGYWGDLTRTVVRGKPSPALTRMYRAVWAAQRAALEQIRPGVAVRTVHAAAERVFAEREYETTRQAGGVPEGFIHSTGHGVGLDIHEEPGVRNAPTRLRAGHVITVEPGLYYRDLGGIRIEDTVVVTRTGWRYLVPLEKRFEVQA